MSINYHDLKTKVDGAFQTVSAMSAVLEQTTGSTTSWDDETPVPSTQTVRIIQDYHRVRDINGTLIGETLLTAYMAIPSGNPPTKNDALVISGKRFQIAEVRPIAPTGIPVMYECDLRI